MNRFSLDDDPAPSRVQGWVQLGKEGCSGWNLAVAHKSRNSRVRFFRACEHYERQSWLAKAAQGRLGLDSKALSWSTVDIL